MTVAVTSGKRLSAITRVPDGLASTDRRPVDERILDAMTDPEWEAIDVTFICNMRGEGHMARYHVHQGGHIHAAAQLFDAHIAFMEIKEVR